MKWFKIMIEISRPSSQENILSDDDLERFFKYATETDLTNYFVVPFFCSLGYEFVKLKDHREKRDEYGLDIAFKFRLPIGTYSYITIIVKARKNIHASSKESYSTLFTSVLNEASMALGHSFFDKDLNNTVVADYCYFITSGFITGQARSEINKTLMREGKRIKQFLDRGFFREWNLSHGYSRIVVEKIKRFLEIIDSFVDEFIVEDNIPPRVKRTKDDSKMVKDKLN